MRWTSIVAIYTLFWALSFFFVLPFRLRGNGECGRCKQRRQRRKLHDRVHDDPLRMKRLDSTFATARQGASRRVDKRHSTGRLTIR